MESEIIVRPEAIAKDEVNPIYQSLLEKYNNKSKSLQQQLNWLSLARLLLFMGFIYSGYKAVSLGASWLILLTIAILAAFLFLVRYYDQLKQEVAFYKALANLNTDEIAFLKGEKISFATGKEYEDPHHPYSFDLDLFGDGGLFPYLNRCSTSFGKDALAKSLLHPDSQSIIERQDAVAELKDKMNFRQHLQAHGSLLDTKEKEMRQLKAWLGSDSLFGKAFYYYLFLFPLASTTSLIYYFITEKENALNLFYYLFILNLVVAGSFARKISAQLSVSTSVTNILQQFAGQLQQIEREKFSSPLLQKIQSQLMTSNIAASKSIGKLASLFNYLETIINIVVSSILNGLFLFHVHILYALQNWKKENGKSIMNWLELLGEVEALNSFGNLAFNNPSFIRPLSRKEEILTAENMGHPLIAARKRISNSISFAEQRFVILTGSNMSGKSTFLRTLGINLILAKAGSNVCASQFSFYPFAVHVSMRITDSLQDSESFFYAELKRLQAIIQELHAGEKSFIILDEILRGTNSNDKHSGTIGLIKKLVQARAVGIIATHDLTVSNLSIENPGSLNNKCFESEIINDELTFDYRLKDGVCTKLSASFLMKKMGIIDGEISS